jgi:hypothetical protein
VNGDGNLDLLTLTPDRGPVISGLAVLLGNGDGVFQPAQFYPAGTNPRLFSIGDLNGDDIPDVAVAAMEGPCSVIGQGDGSFARPQCAFIRGFSDAHTLLTPDLDGDGRAEFVGVSPNSICIWDRMSEPRCVRTQRITSRTAAVGQFTMSGNLDLAVVGSGLPPGFLVCVYAGDGQGGLQIAGCTPLLVSVNLNLAASADLNGDGISDLALAGSTRMGGEAIVMLGNGEGGFDISRFTVPIAPVIEDLAIADLDGDGILDLVIHGSTTICSFFGDGNGGFGEPQCFTVTPPPL